MWQSDQVPTKAAPRRPAERDAIASAGKAVARGAHESAKAATAGMAAAAESFGDAAAKAALGAVEVGRGVLRAAMAIRYRRIAAWAIRVSFLPFLFMLYITISSEGMRNLLDLTAVPLFKLVPFLQFLGDFRETRRIDLAHLLATVLLCCVWVAWERCVRVYVFPPPILKNDEKLAWLLGVGLLAVDGTLFFFGVQTEGGSLGGASSSTFAALLTTSLYLLMTCFVGFTIVTLEHAQQGDQ